jgi:LysR family transcriptional regulator for bpeEF and oprC
VLAKARRAPVPISIVYPQARATAAIRTFVDWIVAIVASDLPQ